MKCVLICQTADRVSANLLAETFGYGPDNFSVALSPNGNEPITHYGGFASGGVSSDFQHLIEGAKHGIFRDVEWPDGLSNEIVHEFLLRVIFRFEEEWVDVLVEMGLSIVSNEF